MPRLQTAVIVRSIVHRDPAQERRKSATARSQNHSKLHLRTNIPIIPQRARPSRPSKPHLNINITLINLEQILQNRIALAVVKAHNPLRHRAVDEQALPARHRVHADNRVAALDVLWAGVRVVAVQVGVRGAVDGVLAVDDFAEVGREFLVGGVAGGPEGVTADGGDCVVVQVGDAGWLAFVDTGSFVSMMMLGGEVVLLTDLCASPACRSACGSLPQSLTSQDQARLPWYPADQARVALEGGSRLRHNTFRAQAASAG